jgi:hypothetical protein
MSTPTPDNSNDSLADPAEVRRFMRRSHRAQAVTGVLHALAVVVAVLGLWLVWRGTAEAYAGILPYLLAAVAFEAAAEVTDRVLERFYVLPAFPGGRP